MDQSPDHSTNYGLDLSISNHGNHIASFHMLPNILDQLNGAITRRPQYSARIAIWQTGVGTLAARSDHFTKVMTTFRFDREMAIMLGFKIRTQANNQWFLSECVFDIPF